MQPLNSGKEPRHIDLPFNRVFEQGSAARRTEGVRSRVPISGSVLGTRPYFKADEAPTNQLLALV